MTNERISEKFFYPSNYVEVNGSKMHFVEAGSGDAILLLHGIPMSSYVWRNIIPYLAPLGRCVAPDLIGCGRSDKPDIAYSIKDHIKYVEELIDVLNLKNLTLVMHGWGSVIGFHYAMQHEKKCKGLVFYEAFLRSLHDVSLPFQEQLIEFQNQEDGYDLAADGASFVDKIVPQTSLRQLTQEEMKHYREPFLQEGTNKPIVQYLKELSSREKETEVDDIIKEYSKKLTLSSLPKLLLFSVPGWITSIATVMWAKENIPELEIMEIGEELHLAQEVYPKFIGETISIWLQGIEQWRNN